MDKAKPTKKPHCMNLLSNVFKKIRSYMLTAEYDTDEMIRAIHEATKILEISDISEDVVNELKENVLDIHNRIIKTAWLSTFPRVFKRIEDRHFNQLGWTTETKLTPDSIWRDSSTNARNLKRVILAILATYASSLAWKANAKYKDKSEFIEALDRLIAQGLRAIPLSQY